MAVAVTTQILTLCDAASIREGLLHVLGAGITSMQRAEFPASLGCVLALQLELVLEGQGMHAVNIEMAFTGPDGEDRGIPSFVTALQIDGTGVASDLSSIPGIATMPLVLNTADLMLPEAGLYRIELVVNGRFVNAIRFIASQVESPAAD